MKKVALGVLIIVITGFFGIATSVADASSNSVTVAYGDKVILFFDEREWSLGADNAQADIYYEYVPNGQTVHNWKELVTLQMFKALQNKTTAEKFGKITIEGLYQICGGKLSAAIIRNSPDDFMFEFQVNGHPIIEDQHEIQRIISGKESLIVLHYVMKTPALTQSSRTRWISILDKAAVK